MSQTPSLPSKPPCRKDDALRVLTRLRDAGHVAYFAGGCVRDLLLGLEPKDWDIATDAPPQRVRQLFRQTQAVGAAFGVVLVHEGRSTIEVATFRAEGKYEDGRRPSAVRFTTAEEDAKRRDFTINGLFLDPVANQIIDYVGGQEDLKAKRLRAIGDADARFAEDHLRLLRAVRFAARFSLSIEAQTAAAISRHANSLQRISPERIADELRLMLPAVSRSEAWRMLWDFGLAPVIFRFVPGPKATDFRPENSVFLQLPPTEVEFALALAAGVLCWCWQARGCSGDIRALLEHAAVRGMVRAMRQALRLSNDELDRMEGTLEGTEPLLRDEPPGLATKKRFLARPTSGLSRQLMEALTALGLHSARIQELQKELAELEQTEFAPVPLVNGDDLVAAGLAPGPVFKQVLEKVYDEQLEGGITERGRALQRALEMARSLGAH